MASPDFFSICAQRKMGDDWRWLRSEVVEGGFLLTGAKPIGTVTRGPNKGKPKFPPANQRARCIVTHDELDAAIAQYEASTGKCYRCEDGRECCGWDEEGLKYRVCGRCKGTSKPPGLNSDGGARVST